MDFEINWKAIYKNKTKKQHNSKEKSKYTDIDRQDLEAIEVYLKDKLIFTQKINGNKRLIMRYRVKQNMMNQNDSSYVFMIGWQKTNNEKNTQEINYIYPNGIIETAGKWDNSKAMYSKPTLRVEEK